MLIKVFTPRITTLQPSYYTTTDTISVVIGFLSSHTNVVNHNYPVTININDLSPTPSVSGISMLNLSDITDVAVAGGVRGLNVIANSFSTELEISGLDIDKVYELTITPVDTSNMQTTSTIISTMTTPIQVVGREHVFTDMDIRGTSLIPLDDNTVDFVKGTDLLLSAEDQLNQSTRGTITNPIVGNAIIIDAAQYYAFCPLYLLTTRTDYPDILYYRPLFGMTAQGITVHKLPHITKQSNTLFKITPATKIRIINSHSVPTVDTITSDAVSVVDLSVYGITIHRTVLKPVFD